MPTSGQLAMNSTTRSPGRTPSAANPAAARRARAASSPEVCQVPSKNRLGLSPSRSRAASARRESVEGAVSRVTVSPPGRSGSACQDGGHEPLHHCRRLLRREAAVVPQRLPCRAAAGEVERVEPPPAADLVELAELV